MTFIGRDHCKCHRPNRVDGLVIFGFCITYLDIYIKFILGFLLVGCHEEYDICSISFI